jgi:hypothetical protein
MMTVTQSSGRAIICAFIMILAMCGGCLARAENAPGADNAYLDALQGDWDMIGTLLGKPVKYHARGERILQGGFLRLHMIDAADAPTYEADLFLGYDAHADDYIGHWLDRFGAAGARVVASGKRNGETLVIQFPYAEAAFKDTFVYDAHSRTWSLLIESQAPGGAWSNFAKYTLVHRVTFEFHSAFLMNVHAYLLDASSRKRDMSSYDWVETPTDIELKTLATAIAFYQANYEQRDLLFDDAMASIKKALSVGDDRRDASNLKLPPALVAILNSVSPIYFRCLWPAQHKVNRVWISQVQALDAKYGADVQAGIEHYMKRQFQIAPIRVDIVVATGSRNGGYTDTQIVLPSGRADYQGLAALEMLYHEATHVDVADTLTNEIDSELKTAHRSGDQLWHAVQFYTVGYVVKDVLKRKGNLDYQTYADLNGVYTRGSWPTYHTVIEAEWLPYLQGHGTMEHATTSMVAKMPQL